MSNNWQVYMKTQIYRAIHRTGTTVSSVKNLAAHT